MRCVSPLSIKSPTGVFNAVPCGKCWMCLARRRREWSFRLSEELKVSSSAKFVTLTYDDDHLPRSDIGFPVVEKRDVQLWLKRLRKRLQASGDKIRYFLVSEYGSHTKRPHYHAILFNLPLECDLQDLLVSTWQKGHVHIGDVTDASISYCAKYCMAYEEEFPEEITRPFMLCSKRPPIGGSYLSPENKRWHQRAYRNYVVHPGGVKDALPRFYKDRIFTTKHSKEMIKSQVNSRIPDVREYTSRELDNMYKGFPSLENQSLLLKLKQLRLKMSKLDKL